MWRAVAKRTLLSAKYALCAASSRSCRHQLTFRATLSFLFRHKIIFRATPKFCFGHCLECYVMLIYFYFHVATKI